MAHNAHTAHWAMYGAVEWGWREWGRTVVGVGMKWPVTAAVWVKGGCGRCGVDCGKMEACVGWGRLGLEGKSLSWVRVLHVWGEVGVAEETWERFGGKQGWGGTIGPRAMTVGTNLADPLVAIADQVSSNC